MTAEYSLQEFLDGKDRIIVVADNYEIKKSAPRLWMRDGTNLSIQASDMVYSSPRKNCGPYSNVEAGYPSRELKQLMPYAEDPDNPTATVYGYVPVEIIEEIISECGGIEWTWTYLHAK